MKPRYRGDKFYYIEVYEKSYIRNKKISELLGAENDKKGNPRFIAKKLLTQSKVQYASFWKNKKTALEHLSIERGNNPDKFLKINCMSREEFIKCIPSKDEYKKLSRNLQLPQKQKLLNNIILRTKEVDYILKLRKLEGEEKGDPDNEKMNNEKNNLQKQSFHHSPYWKSLYKIIKTWLKK